MNQNSPPYLSRASSKLWQAAAQDGGEYAACGIRNCAIQVNAAAAAAAADADAGYDVQNPQRSRRAGRQGTGRHTEPDIRRG